MIAPAIVGGNTCIALASTAKPLAAVTFAEVLATSDLPGGVVNLLTGKRTELVEHFANHMDVNATIYCGHDTEERALVRTKAALNVKRAISYDREDWMSERAPRGDRLTSFRMRRKQNLTWHPVGV